MLVLMFLFYIHTASAHFLITNNKIRITYFACAICCISTLRDYKFVPTDVDFKAT